MDVVVLAGGFGTRLQSVVKDVPKPMADINGIPFLELLLREVVFCDPERIIICISYLKDIIKNYFGDNFLGVPVLYSEETEPLGTGGAIKQAFDIFDLQDAIVLNGDTYIQTDYNEFIKQSINKSLVVVLKQIDNANRYGCVEISEKHIVSFCEKSDHLRSGLINAGIYKINKSVFDNNLPKKFSFEKDILEKNISVLRPSYFLSDGYFIDIGVPESYALAQKELHNIIFGNSSAKALFLDRDGVINVDKGHVYKIEDCKFINGIFDLCKHYKDMGYKIIVVTNQAGIGKGLYTENDYFKFRNYVHLKFIEQNCKIDAEYYCPFHINGLGKYKKNSFYRKLNPGMILQASKDFNIDLSNSILIGDKGTDIEAGKKAGIKNTFLLDDKIDLKFFINKSY